MKKQDKQELKRQWKFFLFYGIGILVIATVLQFGINYWLDSKIEGPPCRIDIPVDKFAVSNNTSFNMKYLFINLRDKDLQIEDISAYCYWRSEEEINRKTNYVTNPPSIEKISSPQELPKIESSKSQVKTASCKSPNDLGEYKIRIIAQTTGGSCEGDVIMEVKNEE